MGSGNGAVAEGSEVVASYPLQGEYVVELTIFTPAEGHPLQKSLPLPRLISLCWKRLILSP
ncbi:MAG: hypothetical protein HC880_10255 [Bacteroidia bacterium]|nr:hypothetical protein [Bacteroidia bacterium]